MPIVVVGAEVPVVLAQDAQPPNSDGEQRGVCEVALQLPDEPVAEPPAETLGRSRRRRH